MHLPLTYLRYNLPQKVLAELYGTSHRLTGDWCLHAPDRPCPQRPGADGGGPLYPTAQLIVDGTLLECWSWKDHPELYSGKHKTTGLGVQVACSQCGTLI